MKKLLFTFLIVTSIAGFGQITIDSAHMPSSGDTLRYSTANFDTTLLLNFQNSGSNLTWNYDSLVPQRQGIQEFKSSSQTPYSSSVSNRLAEKLADTLALGGFEFYDAYNFYSLSGSAYELDYRGVTAPTGRSFPFPSTLKIAQSFSDKDEVYQFPLDYQDRDSSTFNFVYTNQLINVYYGSTGYRINEVDAWGSLTTPYGTFDCIRVITDIVSYDTLSFGTTNFGLSSHQREYKWLTTQFEIPALTVSGTVVAGVFVPTTVQFRDSARNLPSVNAPIALFEANNFIVEIGDTVEFSNFSTSPLSMRYKWSIQPSSYQYVNGTSATTDSISVIFTNTGFYDVQLVAINSSGTDTLLIPNYIRVVQITSLDELKFDNNNLQVYPNPVKSNAPFVLKVKSNIEVRNISLYTIKGSLLRQNNFEGLNQNFKLKAPDGAGIYILKIKGVNGEYSKRLIVD